MLPLRVTAGRDPTQDALAEFLVCRELKGMLLSLDRIENARCSLFKGLKRFELIKLIAKRLDDIVRGAREKPAAINRQSKLDPAGKMAKVLDRLLVFLLAEGPETAGSTASVLLAELFAEGAQLVLASGRAGEQDGRVVESQVVGAQRLGL